MERLYSCPHCGAPLAAPTGHQTHLHCRYCARDIEIQHAAAHAEKSKSSAPPPPPQRSKAPALIAVIALAAVGGGVAAAVMRDRPEHEHDIDWDAFGDPPSIAAVTQDGTEDLIGPFWKPERGQTRTEHTVWIGAFDGATHDRIWKIGPFGSATRAKGATHHAIAGGRVAVTDLKAVAHVYDLKTGKEQGSVKLPDRARAACAQPDGQGNVWIDVINERHVMLDVAKVTVAPAPRPPWCRETGTGSCLNHRGRSVCNPGEQWPSISAFMTDRVLRDGDVAVALGVDATSRIPGAVGLDPSNATRWRRLFGVPGSSGIAKVASSVAEVGQGRLFAQYEMTNGEWKLAAFDARSGQPLWEVKVPGARHGTEARSMVLSSSRVYLAHGDWLDVFDQKTGMNVGDFGR